MLAKLAKLKHHLTRASFGHQLLLLWAMGIFVLALVATLATTFSTYTVMKSSFIKRNKTLAEAFAKQSVLALLYGSEENSKDAARFIQAFQNIKYVAIHEPNHKRLFQYGESISNIENHSSYPLIKKIGAYWLFTEPVLLMNSEVQDGIETHKVATPQFLGYVKMLVSNSELQTIQGTIIVSNTIIIFILSAGLCFIFYKLVNRMVHPLQTLTATMKKREEGQTGLRASVEGAKEIHQIGKAFNQMMVALEERESQLLKEMQTRRQAEENVRKHQQQLAHFSRLKTTGEMASGIAHELNQPLAAIVNYAGGCLERFQASPEFCEVIQKIELQAERAGAIIHRLKDFLRKGGGVTESVDVNEIIENVLKLVELELKQYEIRTRVHRRPCPKVLIDKTHLEQVIVNIIQNAIEAMKENRDDKARFLTITSKGSDGKFVEISITDTGPGIPPEILEKLFDPFFTTKDEGMGMGLSIVFSIMESHGGRIQASSQIGKGAEFRLFLPIGPS